MSDRVRVWCLRHGESENVTAGVAGAVPESPLTERGVRQAAEAARGLAKEPVAHVYSSTALRARDTARAIASSRYLDVDALADLSEVSIGMEEGTSDPVVRRRTAEVLRAWIVDRDLRQQVADGESGLQVVARMTSAFQRIAATHPGETVIVVGHVASLSVAVARLCPSGPQIWGAPLPHAKPFLLELDHETWHCRSWPSR
ncbi:histidine phosphatase family protein [Nocardia altamirensis]|uniref:histidine phosphatase family protein n=1 Tax=Nocardia altamirensis TaxID=472158 RepID=UPI001FDFC5E1|nr:histidine phosphatase family protein [Nocardia altamirensis]